VVTSVLYTVGESTSSHELELVRPALTFNTSEETNSLKSLKSLGT